MRLSPTLSTYIARHFLLAFATVLAVVMGLILLFEMIELLRRSSSQEGTGFGLLLGMALLKLPHMVHTVLPFAVMIGAMVTFWRLTRTHELVVARSAGVSVWQFLAPVMVVVAALGVFQVAAFNSLAANLYSRFERMQDEVLLNRGSAIEVSEIGLWLREGNAEREIVVHSDTVRQEGTTLHLRNVHIFLFDRPDHFSRRIEAGSARLVDRMFELDDVWIMDVGAPPQRLSGMVLPTELTLERVQDNFASPETMSFWQLPGFIEFFEKAGFAANKHRMYFHTLLASPLLLCAMVLVAAVFTLKPNTRSGGLALRIAGGVVAGFSIYFFTKLVQALGLSATVPHALAAWTPAMVASMIGLAGLLHLEDG